VPALKDHSFEAAGAAAVAGARGTGAGVRAVFGAGCFLAAASVGRRRRSRACLRQGRICRRRGRTRYR